MTINRADADLFAQVKPSMSSDTATAGINLQSGIDAALQDGSRRFLRCPVRAA